MGCTADIITAPSKHRSMLVVARCPDVHVQRIAAMCARSEPKLGKDHVVEGSVANIAGRP